MSTMPSVDREALSRYLCERVTQHVDNLRLWRTGFLTPTEPDEQERECVKRELKAALYELRTLALYYAMWNVIDLIPKDI